MPADSMLLDLYACSTEPGRWSGFLDRLCRQMGVRSAAVQTFGFDETGSVRMGWQAEDSRASRISAQQSPHVTGPANPRLDRHRVMRSISRVMRDDELFDRFDPAREALQQALGRMGLGEFMGTLQPLPDGRLLGIALHRAADDRERFNTTDEALLASLAPHVGQAYQIGQRLCEAQAETERLQQQADMLRFGLITCDERANVHWMNREATLLTQQPGGLEVIGGRLKSCNTSASTRLHQEIAAAADDAERGSRFVALGEHAQRLHIAMRAGMADTAGRPLVMLTVTSTQAAIDVPVGAWSKLLGLTAAESALVSSLARGHTLETHAVQRGISLGTARNQLKQALSKTTTSRQADLVRIVLGSAASHVLAPSS